MQKRTFIRYAIYLAMLIPLAIIVIYKYCPPLNYVQTFSKIYQIERWGKGEGSGTGSDPNTATEYTAVLQRYINEPQIHKIVDLGCGDWDIMRDIEIPEDKKYVGYDVVPNLITENNQKFGKANISFQHISGLQDFVKQRVSGDLLIVKDVLQHLPNFEIRYFMQRILPRFKYALITNEYLIDNTWQNSNIRLGSFRALSLLEKPYKLKNASEVLVYEYWPGFRKQVLLYVNPKLQRANYHM